MVLKIFLFQEVFLNLQCYSINHHELNKEIDKLEKSTDYYEKNIKKDKKDIRQLNDPDSLERFAREEYRMKKKDEDIYIIEFDTIKK